jgi:type IV pilus assembly protein PilO
VKWEFDIRDKLPSLGKDPRVVVRAVLGVLLVANLAAAVMLIRPWGGSPQDLQRQLKDLGQQVRQRKATLERLRYIVSKVEQGRMQDNQFINTYMMDRRSTASTIVAALSKAEQEAGIKSKGSSYSFDLIKGSDTLGMMSISANYEGNYGNLLKFVNALDRSPRFVLIDNLQATPQQSGTALNFSMKFYAFVREEKATQ